MQLNFASTRKPWSNQINRSLFQGFRGEVKVTRTASKSRSAVSWVKGIPLTLHHRTYAIKASETGDLQESLFGDDEESMFIWDEDLADHFEGETADGLAEIDPCSGAVVYKRSSAEDRFVAETSLERLDLAKLSSEKSVPAAQEMLPEPLRSETRETSVLVSLRVERSGRDLVLAGEVSTAMVVPCRRCSISTVQKVRSSLKLLLTSSPPSEPTQKTVGVVLGSRKYDSEHLGEEGSGELDLDLDDRVYFPSEEREVDISKHVRDALHLDIPMVVICRRKCKGRCLSCGMNLNLGGCKCVTVASVDSRWGALSKLKESKELLG